MRVSAEVHGRDIAVSQARVDWYQDGTLPSDEVLIHDLSRSHFADWTISAVAHLIEQNGGDVGRVIQLVSDRQDDNRRLQEEANR